MTSYLYHASGVSGIQTLEPRISNHGIPLIYFSQRRENVLVYLCNAVEKYCRRTGFQYDGIWTKWGPYGFTSDGKFQLQEYYPNATEDTYKGEKGYLYKVLLDDTMKPLESIPYAYTSDHPVKVVDCEVVDDAYAAICEARDKERISVSRYEDTSEKKKAWIRNTMWEQYRESPDHPEYQYFLKNKFDFILDEMREQDSKV